MMDVYDISAPSTFRYTLTVRYRDTDEKVKTVVETFTNQIATEPFMQKSFFSIKDIQEHVQKEILERISLCKNALNVLDRRTFQTICSRVWLGNTNPDLGAQPKHDVWVEIILVNSVDYQAPAYE